MSTRRELPHCQLDFFHTLGHSVSGRPPRSVSVLLHLVRALRFGFQSHLFSSFPICNQLSFGMGSMKRTSSSSSTLRPCPDITSSTETYSSRRPAHFRSLLEAREIESLLRGIRLACFFSVSGRPGRLQILAGSCSGSSASYSGRSVRYRAAL